MTRLRTGTLMLIAGVILFVYENGAAALPGGTSTHEWDRNEGRGASGGGIRDWGRNETPGQRNPDDEIERRTPGPSNPADVKQPASDGWVSWDEPEPGLIVGPRTTIGFPVGGVVQSLAVDYWHSSERAAQESLVNYKDGYSAFNGYTQDPTGQPSFTRLGFKTFRTRGFFITVGYIGGTQLGSHMTGEIIGSIRVFQGGSLLKRIAVEVGTELLSDYVGGITGGGGAVAGSFIQNLDVMTYNMVRAAELLPFDSRFGQQPIDFLPLR